MIKKIILIFTGIIMSMYGVAYETPDTLILNEMQEEFLLVDGTTYDVAILPRTVKAGKWSTMVLPFTTPCPEGWQVKEMTRVTIKPDGNINLGFSDAVIMEAGKPYMVRVEEEINEVVFKDITIDTELKPTKIDVVSFQGTYTLGSVPLYGYFISDNKFYRSVKEGTNKVRAYRAFFVITDEAKASDYTLRGEGVDAEDSSVYSKEINAEIKSFYDLLGNKIEEPEPGINLIEYCDGTVVKKFFY